MLIPIPECSVLLATAEMHRIPLPCPRASSKWLPTSEQWSCAEQEVMGIHKKKKVRGGTAEIHIAI
jgi:hypothetical protein